jgi:hypothetical protein
VRGFLSFALTFVATSTFAQPLSTAGNVEVMRLCLSSADYSAELVKAVETVGAVGLRQRVVEEAEAKGLALDHRLFKYVAGSNALSVLAGVKVGFDSHIDELLACASSAECMNTEEVTALVAEVADLEVRLISACIQDYRGNP